MIVNTKMCVFYAGAVFVLVLVDLFRVVVVFLAGDFFVVVVLVVVFGGALAAAFCVFLVVVLSALGLGTGGLSSTIGSSAMISSAIACKLSVVVVSGGVASVRVSVVLFNNFMRGWLSCLRANFLLCSSLLILPIENSCFV